VKEKIVLIGAGSAMFTRGLVADIIGRGWEVELALVDIDPEALEIAQRLSERLVKARNAPVKVTASTSLRDLLPGATCVISTIAVGGRRGWEEDVFIPRKYGIYQPVGDSVMPGGSSRALRMIPAMVKIAQEVMEICPDALFFNYANPMTANCHAVRKATGANMIGLCHGVFHIGHFLADKLGVGHDKLKYTAAGMNHLTWFTELRIDGQDVMGSLMEIADKELSSDLVKTDPASVSPFSWQLLKLFGAFPAVLDRHVCEFFPQYFRDGDYYGQKLGVDAFSFEETIAYGDQIYDEMKQAAFSDADDADEYLTHIGGEHEQVVDIIESIRKDQGVVFSANLPNAGQIPNLPLGAIVEGPVVADASGLRPICLPPLPAGIAGTLVRHLSWVETLVEAALEGSRDKFVQSLVIDGSAKSMEQAGQLADELLTAHSDFLPQFEVKS